MSASPDLSLPAAAGFPRPAKAARARPDHLPASAIPAAPGQFIPSLNGLRAVSIMLVLCSHFINARLFPGGLGVAIFFVISGFLITRLLLAEGKRSGRISLRNFYLRRLARIQPVMIGYVGVVLAMYAVRGLRVHWLEVAGVVFNFANYLYAPIVGGMSMNSMPYVHLWSLSVEEHFYLVVPVTLIFLRRDPRRICMLMLAICAACLAWRVAAALAVPHRLATWFFYIRTDCRLDALAYGTLLAALCEMPAGRRLVQSLASPLTLAAGLLAILASLLVRDPFFRETVRYSVQGLAIACLFCAILFRPGIAPRLLNLAVVNWIGVLSYSLYVWSTMAEIMVHALHLGRLPDIVLCFAVSFLLAFASYRLLERPLAGLRHRLASRPELRPRPA